MLNKIKEIKNRALKRQLKRQNKLEKIKQVIRSHSHQSFALQAIITFESRYKYQYQTKKCQNKSRREPIGARTIRGRSPKREKLRRAVVGTRKVLMIWSPSSGVMIWVPRKLRSSSRKTCGVICTRRYELFPIASEIWAREGLSRWGVELHRQVSQQAVAGIL